MEPGRLPVENRTRALFTAAALIAVSTSVHADSSTQSRADLSLSVHVTPSSFAPGERGTVRLTLHNAGPDAAGTIRPGPFANLVLQRGFRLESAYQRGPYQVVAPVSGCFITYDIVGPYTDLSFGLVWSYYFEVVPAGESRTCTFDIKFADRPFSTFETFWRSISYPGEDPNIDNDRVDYTFIAAGDLPVPVPASSFWAMTGLAALLVSLGLRSTRSKSNRPLTAARRRFASRRC